ncbi:MAG: AI-2E family transporter [Negativicutes bacterium]|nr:AI-2E family transporter [Negativicutes bacterium]
MENNQHDFMYWFKIIAAGILLLWGLQNLQAIWRFLLLFIRVLAPFILGCIIAFIVNVPMQTVEREIFSKRRLPLPKKYHRALSLLLTVTFLAAFIAVVMVAVVPELTNTLMILQNNLPDYFDQFKIWLEDLLASLQFQDAVKWVQDLQFDWNSIYNTVSKFAETSLGGIFNSTISVVTSIFSGMLTFTLSIVFAIYLLLQKEELGRQVTKMLYAFFPRSNAENILRISKLSAKIFTSFLSGQCLEAFILGMMFLISMTIFRFPYALVISVTIGCTAIIPVFGAFIGCVIGAVLILILDPLKAFWFLVLFLILQQVEGNLIYPRVMGNSIGLPAIWVLLAVSVGGTLWGIWGMLLFIPLVSVLYALLREIVQARLDAKHLYEKNLFTASEQKEENEKTTETE